MQITSYYSKGPDSGDIFEQLDREFNNGRFYGLEYVLEDLKMEKTKSFSADNTIDWFGLNDLTWM